ncbi:MAG: peptidoglycan DD-metalloendopeptidase family protein [Chloroflexi bacterium]|nr:peptidoglycan DD-metalloendopeptidase family protein [Chloroflexota bacterium]
MDFGKQHSPLDRILTPLALVIAAVGLVLVIVGPGMWLLERIAPQGGPSETGGAAGLLGGSETSMLGGGLLTRQLVPYTIVPERPRDEVTTYTVRPGDTLLSIAERFTLEAATIVWSNNDKLQGDVHLLQPEMELSVLPVDGAYHRSYEDLTISQIADKYGVEADAIITSEYNELDGYNADDVPPWGMYVVVPGGAGEVADLYKPVIVETQDEETGVVVRSFMPGMGGSCSAGINGSGGTGTFITPMGGPFSFSQGYYPGHSGIDLAAPVGSPVIASDSGVVIFSGWVNADWGYGVLVVLDHGNGWTSYYAHLNSVSVGCGQFVGQGQAVGTVGSTGNSSGPHLHFELRFNHIPDNPAGYIAY